MLAVRAMTAVDELSGQRTLFWEIESSMARAKRSVRGLFYIGMSDDVPVPLKPRAGPASKPARERKAVFERLIVRDKRQVRSDKRRSSAFAPLIRSPVLPSAWLRRRVRHLGATVSAEACYKFNMMSVDASVLLYIAPTARVHPDAVIGPGTQGWRILRY